MAQRAPNIAHILQDALAPDALAHLATAARLATARGVPLYLVGGTVRDLLLGLHPQDLDLTVEGDAIGLAQVVGERLGGGVVVHQRFGTATVRLPDGSELDFATARAETYPQPGALPEVRPGTLTDDLLRRDFACNAIAVRLDAGAWGTVVDPLGGMADIEAGTVRVLHERSFVDDPTRLFRAVRYAGRLGFTIAPATWALVCRDAPQIATLTPDRLRHELELIFREERPEQALRLAQEAGLLASIHPALAGDAALPSAFVRLRELLPVDVDRAAAGFALLGWPLDLAAAGELARRLNLTHYETNALLGAAALRASAARVAEAGAPPSAATFLLDGFPAAAVLALAVRGDDEPARGRARQYLEAWRHVRPLLTGRDVMALGVEAGPRVGDILRRLRAGRLDGLARSREDELRLARQWLQSTAEPATTEETSEQDREARSW